MSDLKLFRTSGGGVTEIAGHSVALEKSLERTLPLIRLSYDAS